MFGQRLATLGKYWADVGSWYCHGPRRDAGMYTPDLCTDSILARDQVYSVQAFCLDLFTRQGLLDSNGEAERAGHSPIPSVTHLTDSYLYMVEVTPT